MKHWTAPKLCEPQRHTWKRKRGLIVCDRCGQAQLDLGTPAGKQLLAGAKARHPAHR